MTLPNFIIGIFMFIICLFLALTLPDVLSITQTAKDLLSIFFLGIGSSAVFIGAMVK